MLTGVALDCVRFWRLSLPLLVLLASLAYLSQHHRLQRNRRRKANRGQEEEEEEEWVRWALDLFSSERWRERVYGWFKQIFKVRLFKTKLVGQSRLRKSSYPFWLQRFTLCLCLSVCGRTRIACV
jgi:hypothetical protein